MNENLHDDIDDIFKKGLEGHTDLPTEEVWDHIDRSLDKKKVISISRKYNKLKWAAAVLLLFSIGMAIYNIHLHLKNKELVDQNYPQKKLPVPGSKMNNDLQQNGNSSEKKNHPNEKLKNSEMLPKNENQKSLVIAETTKNNFGVKIRSQNMTKGSGNLLINSSTNPPLKENKADQNLIKTQRSKNNKSVVLQNKSFDKIEVPAGEDNLPGNTKKVFTKEDENIRNDLAIKKEQENRMFTAFSTTREKYIEGISILPELENTISGITAETLLPNFNKIKKSDLILKHSLRKLSRQSVQKIASIHRFSATVYFSPDVVSTSLKNENDRYRDEDRNKIKKDEQNNFSFTTGILIGYNFSNKLTLESGFTFSSWETNIHPKTIYARQENNGDYNYKFNCSAGYSYLNVKSLPAPVAGDSLKALNSNNTIQYARVPIMMKYAIKKGRFSLIPAVGFSANFLIKGLLKTSFSTSAGIQKVNSDVINGLKPFYVSGSAGIGTQYAINNKLELAFSPSASFSITSINENAPVKTNLYTFGFASGLVYKF